MAAQRPPCTVMFRYVPAPTETQVCEIQSPMPVLPHNPPQPPAEGWRGGCRACWGRLRGLKWNGRPNNATPHTMHNFHERLVNLDRMQPLRAALVRAPHER